MHTEKHLKEILEKLARLEELIMSFRTDADTKLAAQSAAIDALAARIPAGTDPATIVPVADQTEVLAAIDANTGKVNAILPPPPPPVA